MRATEYFVRACDPATLIVRQIMEDAVVTINPMSSAMMVAELLSEHNFGSLPVIERRISDLEKRRAEAERDIELTLSYPI